MIIQKRVFVSGIVQGVGFRVSTSREAQKYPGLHGWVKNLPDSRVEALFSGPAAHVDAMVEWCKRGPRHATVTGIEVLNESVDPSLPTFSIEV